MIRTLVVLAVPFFILGCSKQEEEKKVTFDPLSSDSTSAPEATDEKADGKTGKTAKRKAKSASKGIPIYFVQLGMFVEKENAEKLVSGLQAKNYPVVLESVPHKKHGTLHRVRLRPIANKQSADDAAAEIKAKEGIEAFVTSTDQ